MNIAKTLDEVKQEVLNLQKQVEQANIESKYPLDQRVWIMREKKSWYKIPIFSPDQKIEDIFEDKTVVRIVKSRLRNSNTRGCGLGKGDLIVFSYAFSPYGNDYELEEAIYPTLKDAVEVNEKIFASEMERYRQELEKEKEDKKRRLQAELKDL